MFNRLFLILSLASAFTGHDVLAAPAPFTVPTMQAMTEGLVSFFDITKLQKLVKKEAGISSETMPMEVFTVPGYANWTTNGWNLRIHGSAFSVLPLEPHRLDSIARIFVSKYPRNQWTPEMRKNVRNMTSTLLSDPHENVQLTYELRTAPDRFGSSQPVERFTLPQRTGRTGEFEAWHTLNSPLFQPGSETPSIQSLQEFSQQSRLGNATAYLVPPEGVTVVADIDDILRVTRIWAPTDGMANSFGLDYRPWLNMPGVVNSWPHPGRNMHFIYSSTTFQASARKYVEFILRYYPPGSFDFREWVSGLEAQVNGIRRDNLIRAMQTFPKRRFILLGDTSNSDAMSDYADMVRLFPGQVQCILMRNIAATDPTNPFPYTTKAFKGIDSNLYQFFRTPDDLRGIDFASGYGCRNYTFPQNVTFGTVWPPAKVVGHAVLPSSLVSGWTALKSWVHNLI